MKLRSMVDQPEGNNTAISETKGPRENRSKICKSLTKGKQTKVQGHQVSDYNKDVCLFVCFDKACGPKNASQHRALYNWPCHLKGSSLVGYLN